MRFPAAIRAISFRCTVHGPALVKGHAKSDTMHRLQATMSRIHRGKSMAFWLGKSTYTTVAPPAALLTPGWSARSMVPQLSKVVRAGSLT